MQVPASSSKHLSSTTNAIARLRRHQEQHAPERPSRWQQLISVILPPADPERLVQVAQVPRAALPMLENCLADAGLPAVLTEVSGPWGGAPRVAVLVAARDVPVAKDVVAGF